MSDDQQNRLLDLQVLTMSQLLKWVPYTPQHIYRLEAAGKFPRRIRIGPNRVAWRVIEIETWLRERPTVGSAELPENNDRLRF